MNPPLAQWQAELDELTEAYFAEFRGLSVEKLNWKPQADQWSIGQCIDHLITTNQQYYSIFDELIQHRYQRRFYERLPFLPRLFGRMILRSVQPDTQRKTPTVAVFAPSQSTIPTNILQSFRAEQATLSDYLERLAHLPLHRLIITSPAASIAVYSVRDAIEIILAHEARHLNQALAVKALFQSQLTSNAR
jgi:hypothetical protein